MPSLARRILAVAAVAILCSDAPAQSAPPEREREAETGARQKMVPPPVELPPPGHLTPSISTPWVGATPPVYPHHGGGYYGPGPEVGIGIVPIVSMPWGAAVVPVYSTYGGGYYHETPEYRQRLEAAGRPVTPAPPTGYPRAPSAAPGAYSVQSGFAAPGVAGPGGASARYSTPGPVPSVLQPPGFNGATITSGNNPLRYQYGAGVRPVIPFYQPQVHSW